jgi:hypothetical protein
MRDLLGLLACIAIATGCKQAASGDTNCGDAPDSDAGRDTDPDTDAAEVQTFECWDDPVSSEWAMDTSWQTVTLEGPWGSRTARIRTRGAEHPYSVDLETVDSTGEASSLQISAHVECADQQRYHSNWVDSTELQNPGCPYPTELVSAQAQIRSAHCR